MSEQAAEVTTDSQGSEVVDLPPEGDAAFAALMDTLAPDVDSEAAPEGGETPDPAASEGGQPAPAAEGAGTAGAKPAAPADGDAGKPAVAGDGADSSPVAGVPEGAGGLDGASGSKDRPATWVAEPADLTTRLGEVSVALEKRVEDSFREAALEEVRTEHAAYFEAISKHPRLLVGVEVQSLTGEGKETLRDAKDAEEWQSAAKHLLVQEVEDRKSRALEENAGYLETLHSSIELFQNNADLVPGGKTFDVDLANRFATLVQPYELRVEGKLHGYTIPVQPIINQIRTQLAADRAATAATATPAASDKGPAGAKKAVPSDPPQAGIASKAGDSGDGSSDFSTLFGTIGLPDLRI